MNSGLFDPHKSFLSLKIVWVSVIFLFLFSLIIGFVILANSEFVIDLSFTGFNLFIFAFKFPLAIAALIIPIVALLAANHRSEQTKEQIRVTNAQNVFSNYYKHIDEFNKYLSNRVDKEADLRFSHSNIYPSASEGDYSFSENLISLLSQFNELPRDLLSNQPENSNEPLTPEIRKKYYKIIRELYGHVYRDSNDFTKYITRTLEKDYGDTFLFESKSLIKHVLTAIEIIETFCKFSIDYISPINELDPSNLNMEKIYVHLKPSDGTIQMPPMNKDEQTFEQANSLLIELLKNSQRKN
jgi:hypothetical protein